VAVTNATLRQALTHHAWPDASMTAGSFLTDPSGQPRGDPARAAAPAQRVAEGAEADWIGQALRGQVVVVSEAGHYLQSQRPDPTAAVVLRFLETVQGRA
jgi:pimeloyl-ACP methyl ester carboxylesterase